MCSARYKLDLVLEAEKVSIHAVLRGIGERPGEICGFKSGWTPILSASKVRFRRELKPFKAFRLESRVLWWSATQLIMEQRLISDAPDGDARGDVVHASALMLAGLYDRKQRQFVPVSRLFALAGQEQAVSPEASGKVSAFLAASDALKLAEATR